MLKTFSVYGTGSYTFTKTIKANTKEEAEEIFACEQPEVCYQCGNDGVELHDVTHEATDEIEPEED